MKDLVGKYLEDQKSAWAESTLKSERSRLNAVANNLHLSPADLHKQLEASGMKPYSLKTLFIRLATMEEWANENNLSESKVFQQYLQKHRNKFKHSYVKEEVGITYEEAEARILTLAEPYRSQALGILKSGVRISEAYKVKNGKVKGKGGKVRRIYGTIEASAPKSTFWRQLKSVGLKAHTLRKLCATRLAAKGASPADLCKVFGWSSITTAYQYLQAQDESRIQQLMK